MRYLQYLRPPILIPVVLVVLTAAVYWPATSFEFINFDDNSYVTDNPYVTAGLTARGVVWAISSVYQSTWLPLTWISFMVDSQFSGIDASAFHLTNVVLHVANALLLYAFVMMMTRRRWAGAFIAAVFALHPMHVESVAWVAERKDVLSTLFWMLTLLAYLNYVKQPDSRRYSYVIAGFACALMSKPMVVTLPLVLLVLDWWPLDRFRVEAARAGSRTRAVWRLVVEKIPLFVLSLASSIITWRAMYAPPDESTSVLVREMFYPFGVRAANAVWSTAVYVARTVWPRDLAIFYPNPGYTIPEAQVAAAAAFLVAATAAALVLARRKPYVLAGWAWYLITLFPASGITQLGRHGMADRFTYIPMIGLLFIAAWAAGDLVEYARSRGRTQGAVASYSTAALACIVVAAAAVASSAQLATWRDSITVFTHALRVTRPNALAHHNLGCALYHNGDTELAIDHYRKSVAIDPHNPQVRNDLASALCIRGHFDEALPQFEEAIRQMPKSALLRFNLGATLLSLGDLDAAARNFKKATELDPTFEAARDSLEDVMARQRS